MTGTTDDIDLPRFARHIGVLSRPTGSSDGPVRSPGILRPFVGLLRLAVARGGGPAPDLAYLSLYPLVVRAFEGANRPTSSASSSVEPEPDRPDGERKVVDLLRAAEPEPDRPDGERKVVDLLRAAEPTGRASERRTDAGDDPGKQRSHDVLQRRLTARRTDVTLGDGVDGDRTAPADAPDSTAWQSDRPGSRGTVREPLVDSSPEPSADADPTPTREPPSDVGDLSRDAPSEALRGSSDPEAVELPLTTVSRRPRTAREPTDSGSGIDSPARSPAATAREPVPTAGNRDGTQRRGRADGTSTRLETPPLLTVRRSPQGSESSRREATESDLAGAGDAERAVRPDGQPVPGALSLTRAPDFDQFVDRLYTEFERKTRIERERRGF